MNFELDPKAIRYFLAVAQRGSFSRAATHLRITQPAVSRQIQAIERAYGVRLFRQEGRRMVLTEAGEILHEQGKQLLERLDDMGSLMKAAATEPTGRISIGVTTSPAEILMPEVIRRYRAQHPHVFIHIVQASSAELKELLTHGKLDLALIYGQPGQASATMKPLIDLRIGLVAPPRGVLPGRDPIGDATEIPLAAAGALPLIFPGPQELLRGALEQGFAKVGVTPSIVLESESLLLSKALVKAGVGCMLVGFVGVHEEVAEGSLRFVPVTEPEVVWRMSLALRGTKAPSLAVRTMAAEIMAELQRGGRGGHWRGEVLF